jgi:hypothetical protein
MNKNVYALVILLFHLSEVTAHADLRDYTHLNCDTRPCMRRAHTRGTSHNWSGYVAVTKDTTPAMNAVDAVYGSWIVPTIAHSKRRTWCALWIGIDGFNNNVVEQIGTEHDWRRGQQVDYAWFEMYPQPMQEVVDFPLKPGDHISASVEYQGNGQFLLTIANDTQRVYATVPVAKTISHKAERVSAEWVLEAPSMHDVLPLSHFNVAHFFNCSAIINNQHGAINHNAWKYEPYQMIDDHDAPKAQSSPLSADGKSFTVMWRQE